MPAPYTTLAVANEFVARFGEAEGIEHMKLQKLVYCSYGWWLAHETIAGTRLTNEGPEIWRHGPVFSSLYRVLKVFGRSPIKVVQSRDPFSEPDRIPDSDASEHGLISWVWRRYGHLSSFALSDMTHKPGTPWHRVANENNFSVPMSTKIPDNYIFEEFRRLTEELPLNGSAVLDPDNVEPRRTA